jgi:glycolate oxidase FAD binding subunit
MTAGCDAVAAAANSPLVPSAVELSRPAPGGPLRVGVLLEGSADGVAARAGQMANLLRPAKLGSAEVSPSAPSWWSGSGSGSGPQAPDAGDGTLIQVSFWVSALGRVLDAIDAAARDTGTAPVVYGSAGAGVLYVAFPEPERVAGFVGTLRRTLDHERGGVTVLAAPAAVRDALVGHGGMAGRVPSLALMRAVKDQFDPGHRMAPGRFPEVIS